jgi:outer membrane protein assembly factor BamB
MPAQPVVSCLGGILFAVDPETGAKIWTRKLEKPVRRLVLAWRHVFVATHGPDARSHSDILWFDVHTGEQRGSFDAGFEITAALARGTHLYFAGSRAAIGVSADGSLLFRISLEANKDALEIVARDRNGGELWRMPAHAPGDGALLVGDAVAQPDIDT